MVPHVANPSPVFICSVIKCSKNIIVIFLTWSHLNLKKLAVLLTKPPQSWPIVAHVYYTLTIVMVYQSMFDDYINQFTGITNARKCCILGDTR